MHSISLAWCWVYVCHCVLSSKIFIWVWGCSFGVEPVNDLCEQLPSYFLWFAMAHVEVFINYAEPASIAITSKPHLTNQSSISAQDNKARRRKICSLEAIWEWIYPRHSPEHFIRRWEQIESKTVFVLAKLKTLKINAETIQCASDSQWRTGWLWLQSIHNDWGLSCCWRWRHWSFWEENTR